MPPDPVQAPRLRPALMADLPALQSLIPQSVRALSAGFYSAEQIESAIRHVFGPDTQLIADGTYHVVESNGEMIACGGWSKRQKIYGGDQMRPDGDPPLDPATQPARIRAFFVRPDCARRGLGTLILHRCFAEARAAGFKTLELVGTLPGRPLYEHHGFRVIETIETKLPDGVMITFLRMTRSLAENQ